MAKPKKLRGTELTIGGRQFPVQRVWDEDRGEWLYSILDIIAVLVPDSRDQASYWRTLKRRLIKDEGFDEKAARITQKPFTARDGKLRETDAANRQSILRIIQSVPSPQAEPLRLWLAQVGDERFEEIEHPETAIERMRATYRAKGYDEGWIETRIKSDLIRNELTDEWRERGAKEGVEYAILTNELSQGTWGITVAAHKQYKLLPAKTNLRDHMTPIELALTSLSEATAITYHRDRDSQGFPELKRDTTDAGRATGKAREALEAEMGQPALSKENYLHLKQGKGQQKKRLAQSEQPPLLEE